MENKDITYTRTFNNTSWQSLYIPFSMTYDDWKDDFEVAFINSVRQYDNDEDGVVDETIMDVMKRMRNQTKKMQQSKISMRLMIQTTMTNKM